jgi:formylglycine-generating enzyme required for sulfatase activity/fibronectin type 3 domain-containing protein
VQEATNAAFTGATTLAQTDTSEAYAKTPAGNTTYYYRVRALNACGGTTYYSLWSNTASTTVNVCTSPSAPGLVSPAAGAKVPGPTVGLTWGAVAGATSYDVYLGQGDPPLASNVTGTTLAVPVTEGQSYAWKVVAKNACGQAASGIRSFTVCSAPAPPVANFTWSPQGAAPGFPGQQQPYAGQAVQFTDQSTNSPTAWSWYDFQGAGVSYSVRNPTHTWSSSGPKNVRMNATNCQGSSGEVLKAVTVYDDVRPVTANFTWSPAAARGVAITFSAMQGYTYGDPTTFSWTFKDNNATATGAVVAHTFACGGTFDVVLTAKRGSYQQTITKTVSVSGASCCAAPAVPVAAFTWSPQGVLPGYPQQQQPYVGQQVSFVDQSTNSPTSWAWTGLPDGSDGSVPSPTVVWTTPGTYTVGLTATNCKGTSTAVTHQVVVRQDLRPVDERFDFGTATSPLEAGYTRVVHTTAYSAATGFGWAPGTIDSRGRAAGTSLSRDLNFGAEGTFLVDVPNGIYDVTVISGDQAAGHDQEGVFLEGVQVDTITTARNTWVARVYLVAVADRQLTLTLRDLGGADKFFAINALTVVTAPTKRFDFGVAASPVAAGFIGVPNTLRYSSSRGYGWLTGSVGGRDRSAGDDLVRDINFSTQATFALDLPNGDYDVTVRLGDMGAGHDQAGVFLEGAFAASLTTPAGQFETRTYRTTVSDGQLTVLLDDLGGSDVNAAIIGLEVAEVASPQVRIVLPGNVPLVLSRVPAGTFAMGSPDDERGRLSEEGPQHTVKLTKAYYIGQAEVTQAQWQAVMGANPAAGAGVAPELPVYNVTWNAVAGPGGFLDKLNQHLAATAQVGAGLLRLPTEAEWEHAARGGAATRFAFGDAPSCSDGCGICPEAEEAMWWCGNSGSTNHATASLEPNALGLFDAHGNVWEWVADRWGPYSAALQSDPSGPASGAYRVVRGGDSFGGAADCRAARREYQAPTSGAGNIGLRVARSE